MQELLNGYDEFLESLRKECRSQRNILGLSQEKVCRILEEEYGLIKDIPKISQYESGKTRIPEFLPEYCEILKIKFPKVICEKTSQEQEENYMNTPVISNAIKRSQTKKCFGDEVVEDMKKLWMEKEFQDHNITVLNGEVTFPYGVDPKDVTFKLIKRSTSSGKETLLDDLYLQKSPYPWQPRTYFIRQKFEDNISEYGYYGKDFLDPNLQKKSKITDIFRIVYVIDGDGTEIEIPIKNLSRNKYSSIAFSLNIYEPYEYKLNIQACSRLRGGEKGWKVCKYVKNEYGLYEMKKNDTGQTNYEYIEALPLNGFIWYDLVVL